MSNQSAERGPILEKHISLDENKALSYLPIKTIENYLDIEVVRYMELVEASDNECVLLSEKECCIASGAVYCYNKISMEKILLEYQDLVLMCGFPLPVREFVAAIATDWFDTNEPIMPVIRRAFGDGP